MEQSTRRNNVIGHKKNEIRLPAITGKLPFN